MKSDLFIDVQALKDENSELKVKLQNTEKKVFLYWQKLEKVKRFCFEMRGCPIISADILKIIGEENDKLCNK